MNENRSNLHSEAAWWFFIHDGTNNREEDIIFPIAMIVTRIPNTFSLIPLLVLIGASTHKTFDVIWNGCRMSVMIAATIQLPCSTDKLCASSCPFEEEETTLGSLLPEKK